MPRLRAIQAAEADVAWTMVLRSEARIARFVRHCP